MSDYKTQNLKKDWVKKIEKRLEQFPEYTSLKDFMKQSAVEKLHELEEKELKKKELDKK